jgi:putative ABC transport system permease protein
VVSRDYFETMGIPLVAGRPFTVDDHAEAPPVLLVNETAARLFWRGDVQAAIGGRIRAQGQEGAWRPVVGVVGDVKVNSLQEAPTPMMYFAAEQNGLGAFAVLARTSGDPAALLAPMRAALRETRATLPVTRLMPLQEHLGATLAGPRAVASLLGIFSLLALLLASLGVYAVVSFTVERRSQELGIRAALGAASGRLVRMVVGESLFVTALGVAAGLAISLIAARGLEGMLFGVGSVDGVTFGGAALVLLAAAGAAAFLPARRAARTDPVEVLRSQ